MDYHQHAIGAGADAKSVAYLELRVDGTHTLFGVGVDANVVTASLKAIVSGCNSPDAEALVRSGRAGKARTKENHDDRPAAHFRHHPARRRAIARRLDDARREDAHRQAAGAAEGRRHEAGFPASSNGDFEAVKAIANTIKDSTVCGLSRANDRDIGRAAEALKGAARGRIHTFIATSPLHMEKKLRMSPEEVHEQARLAVRFARNQIGDVEFSPEDGYRSDPDFLCRVLENRDRRRRHHHQRARPPSATPSPSSTQLHQDAA
ncbi:HMGL-like domain-containing protein [Ditylenchus destructor]|uniref:2-isopropylmalate synthase n=1 Tax=Ditylenchus destructor TaxID=166010 RepID=A0AAD4QR22_9BILA|nr:HMGL-like domain-containing protein [Ditylenchus destructor]